MTIVRCRNRLPYRDLTVGIEKFFSDSILSHWEDEIFSGEWKPAIEVSEEEGAFVVKAELPGLKKEEIEVEVRENLLTISGEKKEETKEEGKHYYRSERRYGAFKRSFYLPENADVEAIKASHKEGVLELRIPKTEPEEEPVRKIDIGDE